MHGSVVGPGFGQASMVQFSNRTVYIARAVRLPLDHFPLLQGHWIHPSSQMFSLHAWILCGKDTESRDSLHELPTTWLSRFGFQRPRSMTVSGTPSVLGVQRDRLILSLSL